METNLEGWLDSPVTQAVIEQIATRVTQQVIETHIQCCPHGQMLSKGRSMLIGLCIGSGVAGGGVVALVSKMLMGI
jgi:hypothetical protein